MATPTLSRTTCGSPHASPSVGTTLHKEQHDFQLQALGDKVLVPTGVVRKLRTVDRLQRQDLAALQSSAGCLRRDIQERDTIRDRLERARAHEAQIASRAAGHEDRLRQLHEELQRLRAMLHATEEENRKRERHPLALRRLIVEKGAEETLLEQRSIFQVDFETRGFDGLPIKTCQRLLKEIRGVVCTYLALPETGATCTIQRDHDRCTLISTHYHLPVELRESLSGMRTLRKKIAGVNRVGELARLIEAQTHDVFAFRVGRFRKPCLKDGIVHAVPLGLHRGAQSVGLHIDAYIPGSDSPLRVDQNSWAALVGFRSGDTLLWVHDRPLAEFAEPDLAGTLSSRRPLQLFAARSNLQATLHWDQDAAATTIQQFFRRRRSTAQLLAIFQEAAKQSIADMAREREERRHAGQHKISDIAGIGGGELGRDGTWQIEGGRHGGVHPASEVAATEDRGGESPSVADARGPEGDASDLAQFAHGSEQLDPHGTTALDTDIPFDPDELMALMQADENADGGHADMFQGGDGEEHWEGHADQADWAQGSGDALDDVSAMEGDAIQHQGHDDTAMGDLAEDGDAQGVRDDTEMNDLLMGLVDELAAEDEDAEQSTEEMQRAAVLIQAAWRGHVARQEIRYMHWAATVIQAAWRGHVVRQEMWHTHEAATVIQAVWRGYAARRDLQEMHEAAVAIQSAWRGHRARQHAEILRTAKSDLGFAVVAKSGVGRLGFRPGGVPPKEPVNVEKVEAGLWAEDMGIQVGNELIGVDGRPVGTMTRKILVSAMSKRSLELTFRGQRAGSPKPQMETSQGGSGELDADARDSGHVDASAAELNTGARDSGHADASAAELDTGARDSGHADATANTTDAADDGNGGTPGDSADAPAEGNARFRVAADEGTKNLGFIPSGFKSPVTIESLSDGGWAQKRSVNVGDKLVSVNGRAVADMSGSELKAAMRSRPLDLEFETTASQLPVEDDAPAGDDDGGIDAEGWDAVDQEEIIEELGFELGEEFAPPPGQPSPAAKEPKQFTVEFHDQQAQLGLFVSDPPDPVVVSKVDPRSWADTVGVKKGLVLVDINGKDPTKIKVERLQRELKKRPLQLTFSRRKPRKPKQKQPQSKNGFSAMIGW